MESKTIERFRVVSRVIFFNLLLLTGCARLKPAIQPFPPAQRVSIKPVQLTGKTEISTQYAHSTTPRTGYNTFEIYLENHGKNAIVFQGVALNGQELLPMVPAQAGLPGKDDKVLPVAETNQPPTGEVVWWQFYPSAELKAGQTIVCQINFRALPTSQRKLELKDISGKNYEVTAPRFRQPDALITAITYPLDYSKVYIQYQAKHVPPARVWLNNREVVGFAILPSPEPDTPDMLMVPCKAGSDARFPVTSGMPLHVKLQFPNGSVRQALVRALSGVLLAAYNPGTAKEGADLGLDPDPPVVNLVDAWGGDVACFDIHQGTFGAAAAPVIAERLRLFPQQSKLSAIHYCTPIYPELWNLYGQIADAAYANPYRLGWGRNPARFMEDEESCITKVWQCARPRPLLWIPEAFKAKERFLEPPELESMGWMTLIRGGKGIKYFAGQFGDKAGFADCPPLLAAIKKLNLEVRKNQELLAPLAFVSERVAPGSALKVYTAWSGDQGILIMVRNLDYRTDGQANDEGRSPRFQAASQTGLVIPVSLPLWFTFKQARDLLTGQSVPIRKAGEKVEIVLDRLDVFALVWLAREEQKEKSKLSKGSEAI